MYKSSHITIIYSKPVEIVHSWQSGSTRSLPNNGIDFHSFVNSNGLEYTVQPGATVRPILPGVVYAILPSSAMTGSSILISHSAQVVEGQVEKSDEIHHRLEHSSNPQLHMKTWTQGYLLLTVYSQLDPLEGVEVGTMVTQSSHLGKVSTDTMCHLHLSIIWIESKDTEETPPESWPQFMSSTNLMFSEPPTPVGSCHCEYLHEATETASAT